MRNWESEAVPFPAFLRRESEKLGIRDGSFSHFFDIEKVGKGTVPDSQFLTFPSEKSRKRNRL